MIVSVYAHIQKDTEVAVNLQESQIGKSVTLEAGDLAVLIHNREKLLEIASLLENAAQKWVDEKLLDKEQ